MIYNSYLFITDFNYFFDVTLNLHILSRFYLFFFSKVLTLLLNTLINKYIYKGLPKTLETWKNLEFDNLG